MREGHLVIGIVPSSATPWIMGSSLPWSSFLMAELAKTTDQIGYVVLRGTLVVVLLLIRNEWDMHTHSKAQMDVTISQVKRNK